MKKLVQYIKQNMPKGLFYKIAFPIIAIFILSVLIGYIAHLCIDIIKKLL